MSKDPFSGHKNKDDKTGEQSADFSVDQTAEEREAASRAEAQAVVDSMTAEFLASDIYKAHIAFLKVAQEAFNRGIK